MKIIVIVDNSAGKESVGEMWKETKTFDASNTLEDVIKFVSTIGTPTKKNIVITVANGTY